MKIVLVSSFVPFVQGGARFIVEWLEEKLQEHGHQVEHYYLPFVDRAEDLLDQTLAFRLMDLTEACDRVITFRPPSHVIRHPNKVVWFIHHIRVFYDLWESQYRPVNDDAKGRALRQSLIDLDTRCLLEAKKLFTNSQIVSDRLLAFNKLRSQPLYPPIFRPERFSLRDYGDEIVFICRIEPHKRQHLMIEAMNYVKSGVKLRICGAASNPAYLKASMARLRPDALENIQIEQGWITEERKAELLSQCLAAAYVPLDEDSYGYPSLEAAHSKKAVITTTDSGGVLELVTNGVNGFVCEPDPQAVAEAMDRLFEDRQVASRMGAANHDRLAELNIDWTHVVEQLTS